MRSLIILFVTGLIVFGTARVEGHGLPILVSADASKVLLTDQQIYNSGAFELLGGVILTTAEPGYSIVNNKQGISNGTALKLNVIDQLLYWQNGQVKLDSAQKLDLSNFEGATSTVDKDTVFIGGQPIETYDNSSGWHVHLDYTMQSTSAPVGAYGVLVQLTATGYQKSERFLLVFNNGLSAGAFSTATSDLTKAEFKGPGDANGDDKVDGADYTLWADNYLQAKTWRYGNFNYDAIVDGADYTIWADNYDPTPALASAAAVPEPSTMVLSLAGTCAMALAWWRRSRARRA